MNVIVAGIPAIHRWVNPSFQLECDFRRTLCINREFLLEGQIFRAAGVGNVVFALRQMEGFSVRSVDLRLKEEIGSEPFGWIRVKTTYLVTNDEGGHAGLTILVVHAENNRTRWTCSEQNRHLIAKPDVLRTLANIKADDCGSLARIAAVDGENLILDAQAGQLRKHRRVLVKRNSGPRFGGER